MERRRLGHREHGIKGVTHQPRAGLDQTLATYVSLVNVSNVPDNCCLVLIRGLRNLSGDLGVRTRTVAGPPDFVNVGEANVLADFSIDANVHNLNSVPGPQASLSTRNKARADSARRSC